MEINVIIKNAEFQIQRVFQHSFMMKHIRLLYCKYRTIWNIKIQFNSRAMFFLPLSSEMTCTSSYPSSGSTSRLCFAMALEITAGVLS